VHQRTHKTTLEPNFRSAPPWLDCKRKCLDACFMTTKTWLRPLAPVIQGRL
jgi:hypothetical protein